MRTILAVVVSATLLFGSQSQFPTDPLKEMQKRAEKQASEKNYKELKDAAKEMADVSAQIRADVDEGGEHVISARIFEKLDKIEKLTKRIRDKAKGGALVVESRSSAR